jgi:hypothetical protein
MTDPRDQRLAAILRNAWPQPRPGWEARALAAMAGVRPRRHPNLVTIIVAILLILLLAAGVFAAVRFFVKGTLQFPQGQAQGWRGLADNRELFDAGRILSGELDWEKPGGPAWVSNGDFSPVTRQAAFYRVATGRTAFWPPASSDVWRCNLDGSEEVDLTEGLGGLSCLPRFSPDGSMIAFVHADPVEGQRPCDAGFHLWVMNADGSSAHRVTPEGSPPTFHNPVSWSPDGSRILAYVGDQSVPGDEGDIGAIVTDLWGRHIEVLPNVGGEPAWSPDGTKIVSRTEARAVVNGRHGFWRRVLLTDADGGHPRTLVQVFLAEADLQAHYDRWRDRMAEIGPSFDWAAEIRTWVGPVDAVWSPDGDQIAFLAAMPFDPDGPWYKDQVEVWVYDLKADHVMRITHDNVFQGGLIWK